MEEFETKTAGVLVTKRFFHDEELLNPKFGRC
jgi:hypothetical protein